MVLNFNTKVSDVAYEPLMNYFDFYMHMNVKSDLL